MSLFVGFLAKHSEILLFCERKKINAFYKLYLFPPISIPHSKSHGKYIERKNTENGEFMLLPLSLMSGFLSLGDMGQKTHFPGWSQTTNCCWSNCLKLTKRKGWRVMLFLRLNNNFWVRDNIYFPWKRLVHGNLNSLWVPKEVQNINGEWEISEEQSGRRVSSTSLKLEALEDLELCLEES